MKSFIYKILISFLILNYFNFAIAADIAGILPQGKTQFLDQNGNPLTKGTVDFYIPSTTTRKTTWQDAAETIPNTNPVILDAAGRAIIWGFGSYRQVVKDKNGNITWDVVTASAGSGSGGTTTVGDGNLVGTVLQWSGLIAPPNYVFTYGEELNRVAFPEFLAAVTSQQAVFCTSGSPTLSGIGDTTQLPIGAAVEAACVAPGTVIISKTTSSVTVSNNASTSTNLVATFYPYGNGNGSTTFNVPDFRGRVLAGRDNMGNVAANRLTTTYFANASAVGATGGNESHTLAQVELPAIKPAITITDPGHTHQTNTANSGQPPGAGSGNAVVTGAGGIVTTSSTTGVTAALTANLGSATPFGVVQPSITLNYIIKVTPDTSSSTATGVASLGGMTGVIACGSNLVCTANTISVLFGSGSVNAGTAGQLGYYATSTNVTSGNTNANISNGALTLGQSGTIGQLKLNGSASGLVTVTPAAAAGTWTLTLPINGGTSGFFLRTDGAGTTTWVAAPGTGTVTSVTCNGGLTGGAITTSGTCAADIATNSNLWAATASKIVDASGLNSAGALTSLTDSVAGTVALDLSTGVNFTLTMTGTGNTRAIGNPSNTQIGRTGCIYLIQSATGSNAFTFASNWKFASGVAPAATPTANAIDMLCYVVRTSSLIYATLNKDMK